MNQAIISVHRVFGDDLNALHPKVLEEMLMPAAHGSLALILYLLSILCVGMFHIFTSLLSSPLICSFYACDNGPRLCFFLRI